MSNHQIDKVMAKVRALLDRAASTEHEGERDNCLEKADRLLIKHHLDMSQIDMSDQSRAKPSHVSFTYNVKYENDRTGLLSGIADLFSCQVVRIPNVPNTKYYDPDFDAKRYYMIVGFQSDVDLVYALHDQLDDDLMMNLYTMSSTDVTSRKSFILGYTNRVLERMKKFYRQEVSNSEAGTDIVLASKSTAVQEALDEMFPNLVTSKARRKKINHRYYDGEDRGSRADISLSGSKVDDGARMAISN